MNIEEKASWLANDFNEGMGLGLGDVGILSMASILRVHFLQVKKTAEQSARLTALRGWLFGWFTGALAGFGIAYYLFSGR